MTRGTNYRVLCLKCKQSDVIKIDAVDHVVLGYEKEMNTNILACRWRADATWGFECTCGNDSRLSKHEEKDFGKLVKGDALTIKRIADSLKIPDARKFRMEPA